MLVLISAMAKRLALAAVLVCLAELQNLPCGAEALPAHCPPSPGLNASYRAFARAGPLECREHECDFYLAFRQNTDNSTYLDFDLWGKTTGWVAIGFSLTPNMKGADVFGCSVVEGEGEGEGGAFIDSWNINSTHWSERDIQQDVCGHYFQRNDSSIHCIFSRAVQTSDLLQDWNLNQEFYFLLGRGEEFSRDTPPALTDHGSSLIPPISNLPANPVTVKGEVEVGGSMWERLIKGHGALMVLSYPVLAMVGVFFASWIKPALPNGGWLSYHKGFMICSLLVAIVAFGLAFLANTNGSPPGIINFYSAVTDSLDGAKVAHFSIGLAVLTLHLSNMVLGFFRCRPNSSRRWIFRLLHGNITGIVVLVLGHVNILLGIFIYSSSSWDSFLDYPLYVYLGLLGFFLAFSLLLFIGFCVIAAQVSPVVGGRELAPSLVRGVVGWWRRRKEGQYINMESFSMGEANDKSIRFRRPPSHDAFVRWVALLVFVVVTTPLALAVVFLIVV